MRFYGDDELVLELESNLYLAANLSISDGIITHEIYDHLVYHTRVVHDKIGMYYHNYDGLFTALLGVAI